MEKYQKIKEILDYFVSKNTLKRSLTWDIGTDIFLTWKRMIENFYNTSNKYNKNYDKFLIHKVVTDDLKDGYIMYLNDKNNNVTPAHSKKIVKCSTMRQYLQIGLSLGLISYNDDEWVKKDEYLNINPKFWQIDYKNIDSELSDLFLYTLFNSLDSLVKFTRNFGLSLFLSLIEKYDNSLFDLFDKDYYIEPRTNRNKNLVNNKIYLNSQNGKEYIKHLRGLRTSNYGEGKNTYKTACENILNKYDFDDILNQMYNIIKKDNIDVLNEEILFNKKIKENKLKKDKLDKYLYEIRNRRCKLRNNIIMNRVGTEEDIKYSDIENSDFNNTYVSMQDACHIYDFHKIKLDLSNYIQKNNLNEIDEKYIYEIIDKVDDFNNGILLNKNSHQIFDKNYVWFNDDGKLIYLKECENMVKEAFGQDLNNIYIKKRTLTHRMKEYINYRNKYNIKNK